MKALVGVAAAGVLCATAMVGASPANADVVAYLVNVTVRPGYNFPNAEAAIGYGQSICDRVSAQMSYADQIFSRPLFTFTVALRASTMSGECLTMNSQS